MGKRDSKVSKDSRGVGESGARECFLRATKIELADGRAYTFRALPFCRRTMPIIKALMDDGVEEVEKIEALLDAVEISMGYDQDAATVERVLEAGLISPTNERVMRAMVAGSE